MKAGSHFSHLVDTNTVPSPEDVPNIKRIIAESKGDLIGLAAEMEGLKNDMKLLTMRMNEFRSKHQWHNNVIKCHSALLSPVRALPLDVLLHIFLLVKEIQSDWGSAYKYRYGKTLHPVVIVSHVCRRWGNLSLEMPLLWTTMPIDTFPNYCKSNSPAGEHNYRTEYERTMPRITDIVTAFVQRAGACPISFHLSANDPHPFEELKFAEDLSPLVDVLRSAAWKSALFALDIRCKFSPLLRLFPIPPQSFATIQHLKMHGLGMWWNENSPIDASASSLVNLNSLDLDSFDEWLCVMPLKWEALTQLSIGPVRDCRFRETSSILSVEEALKILEICINLFNCEVRLNPRRKRSSSPPTACHTIALPRLRSLSIRNKSASKSFASRLILPSLRQLSTPYDYTPATVPERESRSALAEWVSRYGSTLTEVSLSYGHLAPSALTHCLERLPNVESLEIVHSMLLNKDDIPHSLPWHHTS